MSRLLTHWLLNKELSEGRRELKGSSPLSSFKTSYSLDRETPNLQQNERQSTENKGQNHSQSLYICEVNHTQQYCFCMLMINDIICVLYLLGSYFPTMKHLRFCSKTLFPMHCIYILLVYVCGYVLSRDYISLTIQFTKVSLKLNV